MPIKPALWHICQTCEGSGKIYFHKHELSCLKCNGFGGIIEFPTLKRMKEWVDGQDFCDSAPQKLSQ